MNFQRRYDSGIIAGLLIASLLLFLAACASAPTPSTATAPPAAPTVDAEIAEDATAASPEDVPPAAEASDRKAGDTNVVDLATAAAARTPVPTATPGLLDRQISEFTAEQGLAGQAFLGIPVEEWFDVVLTALLVLGGYVLLTMLLNRLLKRLASYTRTEQAQELWIAIRKDARWLIFLLIVSYGALHLEILGDGFRTVLRDAVFVVCLILVTKIALTLTDLAMGEYRTRIAEQGQGEDDQRDEDLFPLIMAFHRLLALLIVVTAVSIGLTHFGLNINAFLITLILLGFMLSYGAKDIITDAISGFLILVDRPFRPGDAILIKDLDTWGDVVDIGTRTTRLRTADRSMVAVPNSRIVQSEVVNYTYPEPLYRAKIELRIGYDTDMEVVRETITAAVRNVSGVLADRPVDVLFMDFGESARSVHVRWWIRSIHEQQRQLDLVNSTIEGALDQARIEVPYPIYALQVEVEEKK